MRPPKSSRPALSLITVFAASTTALIALDNSPCAVQCGNVLSSTSGADIVCPDSSYPGSGNTGTAAGITFDSCITCQLSSKYVDPSTGQTDLQWALYNLRYALSWCLFGYPNNPSVQDTPCLTSTACGPLKDAFEFDSLATNATAYGYCVNMNTIQVPKCEACLSQLGNEYYLNNFVIALEAGCEQEPASGSTISIQGSVFSTTVVNITTPSTSQSGSSSSSSGGLTLGAKVGIVVGGIVALLVITGVIIICLGKRRRRRALLARQRASGYAAWPGNNGLGGNVNMSGAHQETQQQFFDSPQSQRPLNHNNWGASPTSHQDESPISPAEQTYFSPYTSQYNSPVSANDALAVRAREWPHQNNDTKTPMDTNREEHRWPIDRKGSARSGERLSSREGPGDEFERIEMQDVKRAPNPAPVLSHPGNGRVNSIPLTEEDARRGNAL